MSNRLTSHYLQHKLNPSFVQSFGFEIQIDESHFEQWEIESGIYTEQ